jgi:hypothetical protein
VLELLECSYRLNTRSPAGTLDMREKSSRACGVPTSVPHSGARLRRLPVNLARGPSTAEAGGDAMGRKRRVRTELQGDVVKRAPRSDVQCLAACDYGLCGALPPGSIRAVGVSWPISQCSSLEHHLSPCGPSRYTCPNTSLQISILGHSHQGQYLPGMQQHSSSPRHGTAWHPRATCKALSGEPEAGTLALRKRGRRSQS